MRDELYATSDPSRAGEVCADTAFCYQQLVAQLTENRSKGWHVEGQGPITITAADLEQSSDKDGVFVAIVRTTLKLSDEHGRVVDANGVTVYDLVPDDPNAPRDGVERWTLVRLEAGWRILEQETIQ